MKYVPLTIPDLAFNKALIFLDEFRKTGLKRYSLRETFASPWLWTLEVCFPEFQKLPLDHLFDLISDRETYFEKYGDFRVSPIFYLLPNGKISMGIGGKCSIYYDSEKFKIHNHTNEKIIYNNIGVWMHIGYPFEFFKENQLPIINNNWFGPFLTASEI